MTYAIIQLNGKQHKVSENDTLVVDRLTSEAGKEVKITDVLLVSIDGKVSVGSPLVEKAVVTAKVDSHDKGDKLRVFKYKSKSRYRKTQGHRQSQTTLTITKISV